MTKGVLVDLTKCIGCGGCSVACKLWNNIGYEEENREMDTTAILNDKNWTVVNSYEVLDKKDQLVRRFVKHQCLHCQEPACASACFSKALQKNDDGAVVYYPDLCVGCRYCMIACPFDIPKYEWKKTFPLVTKCQMCSTRIRQGEAPACTSVCPTGAIQFGERDNLLQKAKGIIHSNTIYVEDIYGEKEVGGTGWLYISDIPFEKLGFKTNLGTTAPPVYSHNFLRFIPGVALMWGALLTTLYYYTKRRRHNETLVKKEENSKMLGGKKNEP
jgi:formate dehydrogenase iron-sulfur subunit